jgi:putative methyltransferase (TIGR04325 family)
LLADVHFTSLAEEAFSGTFSLVLASSSLQYSEDWREVAVKLAAVTEGLLLITRLPVCHQTQDFVVVQRSYGTAYPGWILNRGGFLSYLEKQCHMNLVREFLICPGEPVHGAPEDHEQRGFLFEPRARIPGGATTV